MKNDRRIIFLGGSLEYWIEVIRGEWNWENSLQGGRNLNAPNKSRYLKFFEGLSPGDTVLHYLAGIETLTKKRKSSIVGISKASSYVYEEGYKIFAKIEKIKEFETPIKYSEFKEIENKSDSFGTLVKNSMQRYLTQISKEDFDNIIGLHEENRKIALDYIL